MFKLILLTFLKLKEQSILNQFLVWATLLLDIYTIASQSMTLQPNGGLESDSRQILELLKVDGLFGIETKLGQLIEAQLVSVIKPMDIIHFT